MYGFKSKIVIICSKPAFNGGAIAGANEEQKKVAGYPTYQASRWQAADAALAVINSGYSPLIAGKDLRSRTRSTNAILTNKDVIAVNQDS